MYLGYKNQPINGVNYSEYLLNPRVDGTRIADSGHLCVKSNSADECFDYRNLDICETYLKKYKDDKGEIINFNLGSGPHSSFTKSPIFENPKNLNTIKDQEIFSYNAKLWNTNSLIGDGSEFSNTNQIHVKELTDEPKIVTTTTAPDITTTTTDHTHEEKKRYTQPETTSAPELPKHDIGAGKYHLKVKCSNDNNYNFLYFNRDNNQNFYHLAHQVK